MRSTGQFVEEKNISCPETKRCSLHSWCKMLQFVDAKKALDALQKENILKSPNVHLRFVTPA